MDRSREQKKEAVEFRIPSGRGRRGGKKIGDRLSSDSLGCPPIPRGAKGWGGSKRTQNSFHFTGSDRGPRSRTEGDLGITDAPTQAYGKN